MSDRPVLELADYSFAYAGADRWALEHVSCEIEAGTATRIIGENGSGKSTLMLAFAGLLGDPIEGAARGERRSRAARISSVFQDPQWRLSLGTVADEVAFGPKRQGWDTATVDQTTHEALAAVGLDGLASRSADALSGGQMQRMAIAAALALRPDVLLADEPLSQISDEARPALTDAILGLTRHGTAVVVFEALPSLPEAAFDQTIGLHNGRVRPDSPAPDAPEPSLASPSPANGPIATHADDVVIEIPESGFRLGPVNLSLRAAERLHLVGPNGSGKTSLVKVLAGLDVPTTGCVRIEGRDTREMDYPFGRVAVAMQEPDRQLFARTVADELAVGLERLGLDEKEIDRRRGFAFQYARLGHLAGRNPLSLSGGQKRRLTAACAMAVEPAVLHLDELLAGLDAQSVASLAAGLDQLRERHGTAIVTTSGDATRLTPGRRLVLREGRAFED